MSRAGIVFMLLVAGSAHATKFSYDFDGDFSDSFMRINAEDDRYSFVQEDGELAYFVNDESTSGVTDPENNLALIHNHFRPRYDQSWQASVEVTMPLVYFEQDLISQYLDAGIVAAHVPFGLGSDVGTRFFTNGLRTDSPSSGGALLRVLQGGVDDGSPDNEESHQFSTLQETIRVGLRFDSETRVLSALSDDIVFFSVKTDESGPLDWNMADTDTFLVGLFAGSELEPVTPDEAVTFDNFRASIIPEPSAAVLLLLGCLGVSRPLLGDRPQRGLEEAGAAVVVAGR